MSSSISMHDRKTEAHDPFAKLAPFEQVGRYRLHRKLSEGGMGQVWLAHARHSHGGLEDKLLPYPVAIKFARLSKVLDQSVKEGMLTEGGIMSKLNWGMVPAVHEIGECEGLSYVAMEYIEGVPLSEFNEAVTRNGMFIPFDGVATIAYDAARTLEYIHGVDWGGEHQNLVHCDITDRNFMISGNGRLVLIDFGIAKGPIETSHQAVKGTPRSMAPEQYRGEVTPAVDAYGLGTVLWSLLEGQPFRNVPPEVLMPMVATGQYPPLQRPDIPPALRAICEGLLEPDPLHRMHLSEAISSLERYFPRSWSELRKLVATTVGRRAQRTGMTKDLPVLTDDLRLTREAARLLSPSATPPPIEAAARRLAPLPQPATSDTRRGRNGTSELSADPAWLVRRQAIPADDRPPEAHGTITGEQTTTWRRPSDVLEPRVIVRTDVASVHEETPKAFARTEQFPLRQEGDVPRARPLVVTEPQPQPPPLHTEELDMSTLLHPGPSATPAPARPEEPTASSVLAVSPAPRRSSSRRWMAGVLAVLGGAALAIYVGVAMGVGTHAGETRAVTALPSDSPSSPRSEAPPSPREPSEIAAPRHVHTEIERPAPTPLDDPAKTEAAPPDSSHASNLPTSDAEVPIPTTTAEVPQDSSAALAAEAATLPEPSPRPTKPVVKAPPAMVQVDVVRSRALPASTIVSIGGKQIEFGSAHHLRLMLPAGKKRVRWKRSPDANFDRAPTLHLEANQRYMVSLTPSGPTYIMLDAEGQKR